MVLSDKLMTDEQILAMIHEDSRREKGFRVLMTQYQEMLYQHIRRIVKEHEDTNDVLQNTFIKVFRHIEKFKGNASLYTWIYRIATNEALTQVSKSKKIRHFDNDQEEYMALENRITDEPGPEANLIEELLESALDTLPDKQKTVFSLRYYNEMSYREISKILGTSEGALKASYHHAVKKIEAYFKKVNVY